MTQQKAHKAGEKGKMACQIYMGRYFERIACLLVAFTILKINVKLVFSC